MTTNDEQKRHIYTVLDYIKNNLHTDLSLENLAEVSTYSPYHFHRLFNRIMGETPSDYVKRVRMEEAAHYLIYEPNMSVTEIAFKCGFSSNSYFTSAFKAFFKHSPKAWREGAYLEKFPRPYLDSKKSKQQSTNPKEPSETRGYNGFQWVDLARVKIERLPEMSVLFLQHFGAYTEEISNTWDQIYQYTETRDLITDETRMIGVPHNNPYITPENLCRYDCCITIPQGFQPEPHMKTKVFAASKYVFYEFEEAVSFADRGLLIECYSELYSYWLPKSGYKCLSTPMEIIELDSSSDRFKMEPKIVKIGLPILPK
ncbi:AraC family transcriptional regulator [Pseudalkalibacillus berkeleyi]|uniref:AraC family transcriptional regulator n=1 Tax=Pseudalkalibacillus berkeleyi TaxID=1069813 RepID=A0ABS9H5U6_9BACL|nr:AraC family transcriptional regulator [Pseudalkalibacillus berkeleyi]MCF6139045.1 AraC family transcriptional regulator [Pseudalkalibacillus berkeleyi]